MNTTPPNQSIQFMFISECCTLNLHCESKSWVRFFGTISRTQTLLNNIYEVTDPSGMIKCTAPISMKYNVHEMVEVIGTLSEFEGRRQVYVTSMNKIEMEEEFIFLLNSINSRL